LTKEEYELLSKDAFAKSFKLDSRLLAEKHKGGESWKAISDTTKKCSRPDLATSINLAKIKNGEYFVEYA